MAHVFQVEVDATLVMTLVRSVLVQYLPVMTFEDCRLETYGSKKIVIFEEKSLKARGAKH